MTLSVRRDKMKKLLSPHSPTPSPMILALEASAKQLSVAVLRDDIVVVERQILPTNGHAVSIVPLSIETLKDAGETFDVITHVAAGCGPGSFTGIRVALAAAKGFCIAHQAVGVGLSSLQALARAASYADPAAKMPCLALADTRRGTLYAQLFDSHAQPSCDIFESPPACVPQSINTDLLTRGVRVVGAEHAAVGAAFRDIGVSTFLPSVREMPSASMIAYLAAEQIKRGEMAPLDPIYLADPRLGPKKKSG